MTGDAPRPIAARRRVAWVEVCAATLLALGATILSPHHRSSSAQVEQIHLPGLTAEPGADGAVLVVTSVQDGSAAAAEQVVSGDEIVGVDRRSFRSGADAIAITAHVRGHHILLDLLHDNRLRTISLPWGDTRHVG